MTRTIPLPPIADADGKPERIFGIGFYVGNLDIELTTQGCGAFVRFGAMPGDNRKVEMNADELVAFGKWAKRVCAAMDRRNGEDGKK